MRSYARYWQEVFRLPVTPLSVIRTAFDLQDEQVLRDAYADGKGVICALPHTGNWDYAGAWAVATGMPFTTVAERLEPASLFDRFVAFRESLGFEVIALSGHERPPFNVLTERLLSGSLLCLLADRDLTSAGVPVTFFGATATMPAGPAALALRTGAALLPVTLHYPPDGGFGWQGRVHPAIAHTDIETMTQQMADAFAAGIRAHPADWHMLQRLWRDDLKARGPLRPTKDPTGDLASATGRRGVVKIGLACPYTWDMPGGVQAHVHDLAEALLGLGHQVSVITPVDDAGRLPTYAVDAGRAFPLPYNGSVSRVLLGPLSAARVRRWLRDGDFDILHVHEPTAPSVSLLACMLADGPQVATFHTANPRSRILTAAGPVLQPSFEKLSACIAVSEAARRTIVEHLGTTAVLIPNGVSVRDFADAAPLDGYGRVPEGEAARTVAFLGRIDEPRKGLQVLLDALPQVIRAVPDVRLLVAGPGDTEEVLDELPAEVLAHVTLLGLVSAADKPRVYRSADIYCAPNTGQESFGIVLLEAMAAGAPVLASDLDAFRRVLGDGAAGELFAAGDPDALADALVTLLLDPGRRAELAAEGQRVVQGYDWPVIAEQILQVYETVSVPRPSGPTSRFGRSPVRPVEPADEALDGLAVFGELPTLPPP